MDRQNRRSRRDAECHPQLRQDAEQTFGSDGCRPGLQAIESRYHDQFEPEDSRQIMGSVNIEPFFDAKESKWDYLIGYNAEPPKAYFVEFHPANKLEDLRVVRSKWQQLHELLKDSPFKNPSRWQIPYHWVVWGEAPIPMTKRVVARSLQGVPVQFEGRGPLKLTG